MSVQLAEIIRSYEEQGAEFVGSLVALSVSGDISTPELAQKIEDNEIVPDSWAPKVDDPLSIFKKVMSECNRSTLRTFTVPQGCAVDADTFGGYNPDMIREDVQDDKPILYRVHLRERENRDNELAQAVVNDSQFNQSVTIGLDRTSGTPADDKKRRSTFDVVYKMGEDSDVEQFKPLLQTVKDKFHHRMKGIWTARDIRSWLMNIIKRDCNARSIVHGQYFVLQEHVERLFELRQILQEMNRGVRIVAIPLPRYEGDNAANIAFEQVSVEFTQALLGEVKDLADEIEEMSNGDKEFTARVVTNRVAKAQRMRKEFNDYKNRELLRSDLLDEKMDEVTKQLKKMMLEL